MGLFSVLKQAHGKDELLRFAVLPLFQLGLIGQAIVLSLVEQVQSAGEVDITRGAAPDGLDKVCPLAAYEHPVCSDVSGVTQGQGDGAAVLGRHAEALFVALQQLAQVQKAIFLLHRV